MPIPKPNTGESHGAFVQRCMSDPVMLEEYDDESQRLAVCETQWSGGSNARRRKGKSVVRPRSQGNAEVMIYEDIDASGEWGFGVSAMEVIEQIEALGDIQRLDVRINSSGGDVFEGFAIYNYLRRHQARVITSIDGMALSIASVIAMAGDERHMAENAVMMIHDPWTMALGSADDLRNEADVLDLVGARIAGVYLAASNLDADTIKTMMANETWFSIAGAEQHGFITHVNEPLQIAAKFDLSRYRNPSIWAVNRATEDFIKLADHKKVKRLMKEIREAVDLKTKVTQGI